MKKQRKDMLVLGFALFSMFFGAGNVIFPPFLGMEAGPQWLSGFFCYYMADIGLALVALFAMLHCNTDLDGITKRIGKIPAVALSVAIILCIGPLLAIPRTAASTFEMSVLPIFSGFSPVLFSILFFALIFLLCMKESSVVDIVGKILTPALFVGLLVLIIKGIVDPLGAVSVTPKIANVPASGILAGYQTMDVLAALVFGVLVLHTAEEKGYTSRSDKFKVVGGGGVVAGVGLLIVYAGLTYLGASVSGMYDSTINRSQLIIAIVESLLGRAGTILFGIVVALACITTAVALVSSTAAYFERLSNKKIRYTWLVAAMCGFSAVVSNFGLDQIVSLASPILNIVYPAALTLIALSLVGKHIHNDNIFKFATLGAFLTAVLETLAAAGVPAVGLVAKLPLSAFGFGWVLPAVIFGLVGACIRAPKTAEQAA
ncbi:MAG: branched-chain amino acid transport system II carrier protein [Oscillospiraceae bacterium]